MKNKKCSTLSTSKEFDHQIISLSKNFLNLPLNKLIKVSDFNISEEVYSYVLTTIKFIGDKFYQTGTGPNFEGGIITLCTCKHFMRAYKDSKDWKDVWVCGLVNIKKKTYLQYLMKVDYAVDNMFDLCESLPKKVLNVKSASNNKFGDVYTPVKRLRDSDDKYNIKNYNNPIENHKHKATYHDDINFFYESLNRYPSLLIGDIKNSFIWTKPTIEIIHPNNLKFTQGCKNWKVKDFIDQLI